MRNEDFGSPLKQNKTKETDKIPEEKKTKLDDDNFDLKKLEKSKEEDEETVKAKKEKSSKKEPKEPININKPQYLILVLFAITIIVSFALGGIYTLTSSKIEQNKIDKQNETLKILFPQGDFTFEQTGENFYTAHNSDGTTAAFAAAVTTQGYGGDINLLVGFNLDGTVSGVSIVSHRETRGFDSGGEIKNDFLKQFTGRSKDSAGEEIDAISGATITSNAIAKGVAEAMAMLKTEGV